MSIEVIAFILGAIFLATGVLGGGIELKELKIPAVSNVVRSISVVCGIAFMGLGLWLYLSANAKKNQTSLTDAAVIDTKKTEFPTSTSTSVIKEPEAPRSVKQENNIESIKAEIISAIRLAENVAVDVEYSLNTDALSKNFQGEALKTLQTNVEQLKSNNVFAVSKLDHQQFDSFNINDAADEAEVKVTESWTITYYNIYTKQCSGKMNPSSQHLTIFLKKQSSGWMISSFLYDNIEQPRMDPCY